MFNALRHEQLLFGVGSVLRDAAKAEAPPQGYARGQILSALSITRFMAAELAAEQEILDELTDSLVAALDTDERQQIRLVRDEVLAAANGRELGRILAELLDSVPEDDPVRADIRLALKRMAVREVNSLVTGSAAR